MHTQKPGILGILKYSETFHNCILTHTYKIYEYSELSHIQNATHIQNPLKQLKWSFLQKYLKTMIIFQSPPS